MSGFVGSNPTLSARDYNKQGLLIKLSGFCCYNGIQPQRQRKEFCLTAGIWSKG
jgi:hypothetical protein